MNQAVASIGYKSNTTIPEKYVSSDNAETLKKAPSGSGRGRSATYSIGNDFDSCFQSDSDGDVLVAENVCGGGQLLNSPGKNFG